MKKKNLKGHIKLLAAITLLACLTACKKNTAKNEPSPDIPASIGSWKKITTVPGEAIRTIEAFNDTIYAGSSTGGVYTSVDGLTWLSKKSVDASITALTVFKNTIQVGTENNGIYMSYDGGQNWLSNRSDFQLVSSFLTSNDTLYATSGQDGGILKYNSAQNSWSAFESSGLPTNYSLDVHKLIAVNNSLLSVQGVNGTFYLYNKNTKKWTENYYFSGAFKPGLKIDDIIFDAGNLYASYNTSIISSTNNGANWSFDTVGLKKEKFSVNKRTIYAGSNKYYTIYVAANNDTWLQQRNKSAAAGSTWATGQEHLPIPHAYAIREFKGMLFLATDNGIYYKKI